jgi:hypothetical protein
LTIFLRVYSLLLVVWFYRHCTSRLVEMPEFVDNVHSTEKAKQRCRSKSAHPAAVHVA